jgi:hypothetical protein
MSHEAASNIAPILGWRETMGRLLSSVVSLSDKAASNIAPILKGALGRF